MTTGLKCLACGEVNASGEDACKACSSSLNLKLCSACEAMNAGTAARCHACGFAFDAFEAFEARVDAFGAAMAQSAPSARTAEPIRATETAIAVAGKAVQLPPMRATRADPAAPAPRRSRRAAWRALLLAAPLAAIGSVAFLFYPSAPSASVRGALSIAPQVDAPALPEPLLQSEEAAPAEPAAPIAETPRPQPRLGRAPVTHTKKHSKPAALPLTAAPADCVDSIAALGLCGANQKGRGN